ncbi:DegT/DnrJ/EryC1/StrS family aminotransferase [Stakelama saccharophila]|uniref:DegT/DnrJ/EryC1/StrS family aminotransferase n=1 Tax=Stakelama saccharophila TaxID=3075605 RepID=A0ABZ0BDI8_9SPHN|nr:DegT/DnrJ/EryC1/StrS family aminotransferase [Stakelama sp. W311]WNO54806.1 DegT/DnrJ/EryC1/StrS family aminotransferase [Stakelama sp. W311]
MSPTIPLIAPRPVPLSSLAERLAAMEARGIYSNAGPLVRGFEEEVVSRLFDGRGAGLAVANATLGLMLAIRQAAGRDWRGERFAMMPAFTFAATAQAAQWAGLTPLFVDSDPDDWSAAAAAEEAALAAHGDRIAVVVPYATFGNGIDLARYRRLQQDHGVAVVVDAAASLGGLDCDGHGIGTGMPFATVFSMHATKPFATAEGGLIYSGDVGRIDELRDMVNFGFTRPRCATLPGLNAKLPEVIALMAHAKLAGIDAVGEHRAALAARYGARLGAAFDRQRPLGRRPMAQFQSLLLPEALAVQRDDILRLLDQAGIGAAHYFAPHCAQQPHFRRTAISEPTPVADAIGRRIVNLPLHEAMAIPDVDRVCDALLDACETTARPSRVMAQAADPAKQRFETVMIGGGPAGMAVLTAAAKAGRLEEFASGLAIADAGDRPGSGNLGNYAITSDSTAETFLSAAKDSRYPELAALVDHPAGLDIARFSGALGVPLARTRPFLEGLARELTSLARRHGGAVETGLEAIGTRRLADGGWVTTLRDRTTGAERCWRSDNIVLATGGYQCADSIRKARIDDMPLHELAGDRLVASDPVLRLGGVDDLRERLAGLRAPRIAVIGASTSALAAVTLLLKAQPALPLGAGAVTLLHRQPLRPFYPSVEAARADGFTDFGPDDICPVSGFVYRLAGFRLEARELVLRMLGIGGRVPDPRVALHHVAVKDRAARRIVEQADLVIAALGYRPRALPLFGADGRAIALAAHAAGRPRMVDQQCRVMDASGAAIPGAFGIGLAAGFVPEGALGGEPSFTGKANGLWLWQNDVGRLVVDQVLARRSNAAAA